MWKVSDENSNFADIMVLSLKKWNYVFINKMNNELDAKGTSLINDHKYHWRQHQLAHDIEGLYF